MTVELLSGDWGRFAEKLRQNGYALLLAANPKLVVTDKGTADPNIIAATLFCRSLTHFKAIPILLKEGLIVEARTIVRNCFENAFWLAALAESDERDEALRRMGDAELFSRHQIGQFAMQLRGEQGAEVNEALREAMRKFDGKKGTSGPTPKDLAKLGQFKSAYLFYAEYSRDAHPTLHSLARYLSRLEENGEVFKCLDAVPSGREGDEFTIRHACQAVLSAMFAANEIWAAGEASRLTELAEEYSSLAGLGIVPDSA
ncbi:MAG TPA: hypothetical protein DEA80_17580 [Afipia sp.]|uniref:DUF5677 domain-containing protein n=1 Tax=unclassified Afipia TaxID=2642050 RepID=UPI00046371DC|nr:MULTISPECIES: DUF5677 domain-containing protein [unclassified Afipia]MAH68401.1 hypothetical protein [Afipia sp.]OUX62542.1 MAG: hypothetical protein CBB64_04075 [Afipia sp. TMED4]HAO42724.1 hypothetical protein [Afipia sp.]HAP12898.1 hypothetical protein [Afipia sp.]HAP48969.1 hypothetical protein [Afipia sp.]